MKKISLLTILFIHSMYIFSYDTIFTEVEIGLINREEYSSFTSVNLYRDSELGLEINKILGPNEVNESYIYNEDHRFVEFQYDGNGYIYSCSFSGIILYANFYGRNFHRNGTLVSLVTERNPGGHTNGYYTVKETFFLLTENRVYQLFYRELFHDSMNRGYSGVIESFSWQGQNYLIYKYSFGSDEGYGYGFHLYDLNLLQEISESQDPLEAQIANTFPFGVIKDTGPMHNRPADPPEYGQTYSGETYVKQADSRSPYFEDDRLLSTITVDGLNFRREPVLNSSVIGMLNRDDSFNIIGVKPTEDIVNGESGHWIWIEDENGTRGWIWGNYIKEGRSQSY